MTPADRILEAVAAHRQIEPLTASDPSLDEDRAYAIAHEIFTRRVARGERPLGRKIGFTNRTIWPEYGVYTPIWSHVYDSTTTLADGPRAAQAVGHLLEPRIEPEIMLHFARTPPVTRDPAAILESIDWIAHGFEIVQSVYPGWRFKAPDTMAAFAMHGALVVGPPVAVAGIPGCVEKLARFRITLSKNGEVRAEGGGANVLDSPLLAFAHMAALLAAQSRFPAVAAGEIVSTGTLTAALPVQPGETWSTALSGIELPGFTLEIS